MSPIANTCRRLAAEDGFLGRVWVGLAMAVALAGGGLIYQQVDNSGADAAALGNLWVDTSGGTCTRQSTAGAYVDAQACSTMSDAYAAASCGDYVNVKGGTYGNQNILETAGGSACTGNPITIRENQGENAVVQNYLTLGSGLYGSDLPDNLTLRGFTVTRDVQISGDANNVTVDGFNGGSWFITPSPASNDATNITVENSEWGPCGSAAGGAGTGCERNHIDMECSGTCRRAVGVSILNNDIHGYTITQAGDHWECVFVEGGENVTFRGNHFWDCETNAVALPHTQMYGTWYFENNIFGYQTNAGANAALKFANNVGETPAGTVVIRYNSFHTDSPLGSEQDNGVGGKVRVIGNIIGDSYGCISGAAYFYNVFYAAKGSCSGTGNTTVVTLPYVSEDDDGSYDYRLDASSAADNIVPADVDSDGSGGFWGNLTSDRDGNTRPNASDSGNRDAGAYERDSP